MRVLMKNDDIQILHTEKQDIPFIVDAEQQHENAKYIGQWSFEQHINALDDEDVFHLIIKNTNAQPVGYAIIRGVINQNDCIELMRIVIIAKGLGYGKSAVSLLKKWCFEIKHIHRLWLDVREDNIRAQHVYKTQGFKQEGVLRECIKTDNSYQSLIIMSILSQEYHAK